VRRLTRPGGSASYSARSSISRALPGSSSSGTTTSTLTLTQNQLAPDELADKRHDLAQTLHAVLKKANYKEISHQEVEDAHNQRHLLRLQVRAPLDDYHLVQFYERGRHTEKVDVRKWFGLSPNMIDATMFDNVVLVLVVKSLEEITSKGQRKRLEASDFKPGTILIKYFRNITASDLYMLLPRVRVVMSFADQLTIGVPAVAGAVPLLLNLLPALTVLSLVAGYFLGLTPVVDTDTMVKSFGALTGIAAIVGFILTQRMKYQKRSLEYQKEISDHFYFRNVSNNSGIFDTLVGSAEDQEFKEATLAYFFLLMAGAPLTQKDLDSRIEDWFRAKHQLDLDFGVEDAVAKLERLELLQRSGQAHRATSQTSPRQARRHLGQLLPLCLASRRNPQHSKRRIEPAGGNVVDQQWGGSGLHPIRVDHE
jgi:Protein of unknown function (DUF3754)